MGQEMRRYVILPFTLAVLLLSSCTLIALQGSGNVITETREVGDFEAVEVCCGMQLVLTQGEPKQLILEGEDNILPEIETGVHNETLGVRFHSTIGLSNVQTSRPITVYLQMPMIRGVDISGGGSLETEKIANNQITLSFSGGSQGTIGQLEAERVKLDASGGSQVEIAITTAANLEARVNGGKVTINGGTATEQQVTASGGSHYLAADVESERASVEVSGGGEVQVWVTDALDVQASGGSDVEYTGNPMIDQELSGGSAVRQINR